MTTIDDLDTARAQHAAGKVFEVTAWREAPWWVLHSPEVGVTQVRFWRDAEWMARDMVACMLDVDPCGVQVEVVRGIGPVQDPGSCSASTWLWATVAGVRDRFR